MAIAAMTVGLAGGLFEFLWFDTLAVVVPAPGLGVVVAGVTLSELSHFAGSVALLVLIALGSKTSSR